MKWYSAIGTLNYDNKWLVLNGPNSIAWYYSRMVEKLIWKKVSTPLHGLHVTVVAGKYQDVTSHSLWEKRQGQKVLFEYSSVIYTDGSYFWLKVKCDELNNIRRELGLSDEPFHPYHATVAYLNVDTSQKRK